jgi:hypothetical protein
MSLNKALNLIKKGKIIDARTILIILYYKHFIEKRDKLYLRE